MASSKELAELPFLELLEAFAARTPTPGGGAAAGLSAALGAALGAMAFRFSRKKDDLENELEALAGEFQEAAFRFAGAAQEDCKAYEEVRTAFRLPKDTEEQKAARGRAVRDATLGAMASPLSLMEGILETARALEKGAGKVKSALASDLASAAWCLRSGAEMAWLNVRINAGSLPGEPEAEEARKRGEEIRSTLLGLLEGVLARAEENL